MIDEEEIDRLLLEGVEKGGHGSGHHGHHGRPGERGGSKPVLASGFRGFVSRALSKLRAFAPRFPGKLVETDPVVVLREEAPEDPILSSLVAGVLDDWQAAAPRIGGRDADEIGRDAASAWAEIMEGLDLRAALGESIAASGAALAPEEIDRLLIVGEQWAEEFVEPLIERRLVPQLDAALGRLAEDAGAEIIDGAVQDVLARVPGMFEVALQPMLRRLVSFGELLATMPAAKADNCELARFDHLLAIGAQLAELEQKAAKKKRKKPVRYMILTAGDSKVCNVCEHISFVSREGAGFLLTQAMALFFGMEATDSLESGLHPFPTFAQVDGLGSRGLTKIGAIVPPFHPRCRCRIVLR